MRLKQYLSITYAYPEPMLKTESNGGTITRKQLMTLENWECFTEHPVLGDRFSIIDSVQRLYGGNLSWNDELPYT